MNFHLETSKVTPSHLARNAIVYVRQSTGYQVLHNTASADRQYDMADHARMYGWEEKKIIIIDKDQGLSGASAMKREGFKEMVMEIIEGRVGAVFSLEASRLAREDVDWQQLIQLCGYSNTLIGDEGGIYAVREINDKLLLDFKGIFAVFERYIIKCRLNGGRLKRAEQGKLRTLLPPGYVYSQAGAIIMDPDEGVRLCLQLFFEQFKLLGSCAAVARSFHERNIRFPTRVYDRSYHAEYRPLPLTATRAVKLIRNPLYAGMYVYGRRQTVQKAGMDGDRVVLSTKIIEASPEDWIVVIPGSHEPYITEEQYRENLLRLRANQFKRCLTSVGVARPGAALLQGIVRCGVCGMKMAVHYQGKNNAPSYQCFGVNRLVRSRSCTSVSGVKVDPAVTQYLLRTLAPAQAEASFGTIEQIEADLRREVDLAKSRVDEAERQAAEAEHLFRQAAPKNEHVRAALEDRWEEASIEVENAKREFEFIRTSACPGLQPEEKEVLLKLIGELPKLWVAPETTQQDRKELLRLVIQDVLLVRVSGFIKVTIRWQGGGRQEFDVLWPNYPQSHMTDPMTIDLIRRLAVTHTDTQIAEHLNREGIQTLRGKQFNRLTIFSLRDKYGIRGCNSANYPGFDGRREDGRYSVTAVAKILDVKRSCIIRWCSEGKLDAARAATNSKLWIKLDPEDIPRLKQSVRRVSLRSEKSIMQP